MHGFDLCQEQIGIIPKKSSNRLKPCLDLDLEVLLNHYCKVIDLFDELSRIPNIKVMVEQSANDILHMLV